MKGGIVENWSTTKCNLELHWGEEFDGKSRQKITDLKKLLKPLGVTIPQNHKGQSQENGFVDRSHRTDDEEFYVPMLVIVQSF